MSSVTCSRGVQAATCFWKPCAGVGRRKHRMDDETRTFWDRRNAGDQWWGGFRALVGNRDWSEHTLIVGGVTEVQDFGGGVFGPVFRQPDGVVSRVSPSSNSVMTGGCTQNEREFGVLDSPSVLTPGPAASLSIAFPHRAYHIFSGPRETCGWLDTSAMPSRRGVRPQ